MNQLVSIILLILTVTVVRPFEASPINGGDQLSCHSVRQYYHQHHHQQLHQLRDDRDFNHGSHSSSSLPPSLFGPSSISKTINCPASNIESNNNCCHGMYDVIGTKAYYDFQQKILLQLNIETLRQKFQQYSIRINHKLSSILNETIAQVDGHNYDQNGPEKSQPHRQSIVVANRQLLQFVMRSIFQETDSLDRQQQKEPTLLLEEQVDHLLGAIFITVLQQLHQKDYPPEYESCLLNTLKESDILAKSRDEILFRFTRTIQTSSLIVNLMKNSWKLINETANGSMLRINEKCVQSLAQTFHCQRCSGQTMLMMNYVEPCSSVCLATIQQDCLNQPQMNRLDSIMKSLTNSYQQLVNLMVNQFNPEMLLLSNHLRSIERAKETVRLKQDKIAKNARIACGLMKRYFRSAGNHGNGGGGGGGVSNAYDYYNYSTPTPNEERKGDQEEEIAPGKSLYVSLQSVAHLFAQHKNMFADLEKKFCNQYKDHSCWNGSNVVENFYQEKPEYRQPKPLSLSLVASKDQENEHQKDYIIMSMDLQEKINKSQSTIEQLLNQIIYRHKQSLYNNGDNSKGIIQVSRQQPEEDQLDDGSGSGAHPFSDDDEDYSDGGSGGGGADETMQINPNGGGGSKPEIFTGQDIVFDPKPVVPSMDDTIGIKKDDQDQGSRSSPLLYHTSQLFTLIILAIVSISNAYCFGRY